MQERVGPVELRRDTSRSGRHRVPSWSPLDLPRSMQASRQGGTREGGTIRYDEREEDEDEPVKLTFLRADKDFEKAQLLLKQLEALGAPPSRVRPIIIS